MDLYREEILDHYRNPRNFGELGDASIVVREANASCGDLIELSVKLVGEGRKRAIGDIRFKGLGCALSIAAASMLTEKIKRKSVESIRNFNEEKMLGLLGSEMTSARKKCVFLGLRALERILQEVDEE